jgi:hypothetical protein
MKAIQMAMRPIIMNQSRPSHSIGIIIKYRLPFWEKHSAHADMIGSIVVIDCIIGNTSHK